MMGAYHRSNSSDNPIGLAFALIAILAGLIACILAIVNEKKRKKEIKEFCIRNNIEYSQNVGRGYFPKNVKDCETICRGIDNKFSQVMKKNQDGFCFYIFDYIYHYNVRTKKGTSREYEYETVCCIIKQNINLPKFLLIGKYADKSGFNRLENVKDIKVDDVPGFEDKFILKSNHQDEVKEFFNKKVINAFINKHNDNSLLNFKYEGNADCFMVARRGGLGPKDRLDLLKFSTDLLNEITS